MTGQRWPGGIRPPCSKPARRPKAGPAVRPAPLRRRGGGGAVPGPGPRRERPGCARTLSRRLRILPPPSPGRDKSRTDRFGPARPGPALPCTARPRADRAVTAGQVLLRQVPRPAHCSLHPRRCAARPPPPAPPPRRCPRLSARRLPPFAAHSPAAAAAARCRASGGPGGSAPSASFKEEARPCLLPAVWFALWSA
jgi:hypothetical protein